MRPLVRRADWGAKPPKGRPKDMAAPVKYLFLHHSAGQDGDARIVRGIQSFHQQSRGWSDIAYTWIYSPTLRTWFEGRGPGITGAHTRGYNTLGHAVCVLGNYEKDPLPAHAIDDLAEWAHWHGGTWGPDQYVPHRDMGETACPGRNIVAVLDTINTLASGKAAPVVHLEPEPSDEDDDDYDAAFSYRKWQERIAKGLRHV